MKKSIIKLTAICGLLCFSFVSAAVEINLNRYVTDDAYRKSVDKQIEREKFHKNLQANLDELNSIREDHNRLLREQNRLLEQLNDKTPNILLAPIPESDLLDDRLFDNLY